MPGAGSIVKSGRILTGIGTLDGQPVVLDAFESDSSLLPDSDDRAARVGIALVDLNVGAKTRQTNIFLDYTYTGDLTANTVATWRHADRLSKRLTSVEMDTVRDTGEVPEGVMANNSDDDTWYEFDATAQEWFAMTSPPPNVVEDHVIGTVNDVAATSPSLFVTGGFNSADDRGEGLYATVKETGALPAEDNGITRRVVGDKLVRLVSDVVNLEQAGFVGYETQQEASESDPAIGVANFAAWQKIIAIATDPRLTIRGDRYYPIEERKTVVIPRTFLSALDIKAFIGFAATNGANAAENAANCTPTVHVEWRSLQENERRGDWKVGAIRQGLGFTAAGNANHQPWIDQDFAWEIDPDLRRGDDLTPGGPNATLVNSQGDTLLESLSDTTDIGILIDGHSGLDRVEFTAGGYTANICVDVFNGSPFAWSNPIFRTRTNSGLVQYMQRHSMDENPRSDGNPTLQSWANEVRVKITSAAGIDDFIPGPNRSAFGIVQFDRDVVRTLNPAKIPDHDPAATYAKGQAVMSLQSGRRALWRSGADGTSGAFSESDWQRVIVGMNAFYIELQDGHEFLGLNPGFQSATAVLGTGRGVVIEKTRVEAQSATHVYPKWPCSLQRTRFTNFTPHSFTNSTYGKGNGEINYLNGSNAVDGYNEAQAQWENVFDSGNLADRFWYDGFDGIRSDLCGQGYDNANGGFTMGRPEDYQTFIEDGGTSSTQNRHSLRLESDGSISEGLRAGMLRFRLAIPGHNKVMRLRLDVRDGGNAGGIYFAGWPTEDWDNDTLQMGHLDDWDYAFGGLLDKQSVGQQRYVSDTSSNNRESIFGIIDDVVGLSIGLISFTGLRRIYVDILGYPHVGRSLESDLSEIRQVHPSGVVIPNKFSITAAPEKGYYRPGNQRFLPNGDILTPDKEGYAISQVWNAGDQVKRTSWLEHNGNIYQVFGGSGDQAVLQTLGATPPTHSASLYQRVTLDGDNGLGAGIQYMYIGSGSVINWLTK